MPQASASSSTSTAKQYPCILKVTNGKSSEAKVKISTLVQPSDDTSFTSAYVALLKSSCSTLKKKDKRKKDAKKAKAPMAATKIPAGSGGAAKKTKTAPSGVVGLPKVTGARRGAGHAKRQQKQRARDKAVKRHLEAKRRKLADTKLLTKVKEP